MDDSKDERVVYVNTVENGGINVAEDKDKSRRNDNDETRFLLAASLITDAQYGRTLPYHEDLISLRRYRTYDNKWLRMLTIAFMWFDLALALFEVPAKTNLELKIWATMLMETLCLSVFCFRLWQMSRFVPRKKFLYDPKNIVVLLTLIVTIADMIIHIGIHSSGHKGIRVSRVLRPLFLINMNESRQIRRAFRNIRSTVPEIFSVLVLFFFSISIFALMALKFFDKRSLVYITQEPYFINYWDSYFDLYVLVTTANSPDVMMPAYNFNPWFMVFFFFYIIVNTYIFMNLILAVIYNSYKKHLKKEVVTAINEKKQKLAKAFSILRETDFAVITYETWTTVMRLLPSKPKSAVILLLWKVLHDNNAGGGLTQKEFSLTADALNVKLVDDGSEDNLFAKRFPNFYYSKPIQIMIAGVRHKLFTYAFDILIIANAICIGYDLEKSEWFFLCVFMIEIILRMFSQGPKEYFSVDRLWNWFDFLIITAAFIGTIIEASLDELGTYTVEFLDFLMILRCLRLIKIVDNIESFRTVVMTIVSIAPSLITYGGVLLMTYYVFAIIGMEAFAGKITYRDDDPNCGRDDTLLADTQFSRMGYCNNNFNDIVHSFVLLFELTVVNQWHVITQGYVTVTSKAARLYFISFHIVVVLLLMNIIVAFVLEAFMLEYTPGKKTIEDKVQAMITEMRLETNMNVSSVVHDRTTLVTEEDDVDENVTYVGRAERGLSQVQYRFRINPGHKNIESLLQRMFEEEVSINDGENRNSSNGLDVVDAVHIGITFDPVSPNSSNGNLQHRGNHESKETQEQLVDSADC